jgi:hypothetical protein
LFQESMNSSGPYGWRLRGSVLSPMARSGSIALRSIRAIAAAGPARTLTLRQDPVQAAAQVWASKRPSTGVPATFVVVAVVIDIPIPNTTSKI